MIRDITNGFLPPEPYPEERIIQLVCTNIDSFTSLEIDGIRIVDESVLIRFFSDNGQYVKIWSGSKIYKKRKYGKIANQPSMISRDILLLRLR